MHLGHLRNNLIGISIVNLLKSQGAEVVSDGVYNNRGIAIAKNMYGFLYAMRKEVSIPVDIDYWFSHQSDWLTPEEKGVTASVFATECYVAGEDQFQASEEIENLIRQMVVDWEAGEEKVWALWKLVLEYAYEGIENTMRLLDSRWDNVWYEHEHYKAGKEYVEKGLEQGIFERLEDGAVLTKIESKYNLPETILLKKDGTSLYITQDLALTDLKKKQYKADKLVWVVGPEQTLAFKQLFAVCEQLGIGRVEDFTHIPYGYVGLKGADGKFQKMSSRSGTAVFIDDLLEQIKTTVRDKTTENSHDEDTVEKLALAAVKFAFLKSDSHLDMLFDINQSVDVHGDSGLYVMYTYVRAQSILRKSEFGKIGVRVNSEISIEAERDLVRLFQYYEDVVSKSAEELSVHHVTQYLLELSSEFNSWYAKETIVDGSDRESYRMAIVLATSQIIEHGFSLLGTEVVDKM
jgi:arginyl-tRNA synthetase